MNCAVVSMAAGSDEYRRMNEPCLNTHVLFCKAHGLRYHLATDLEGYRVSRGIRPPPWYKILLVRDLLESNDFVFWIDCDAMFVDPRRDFLTPLSSSFSATGRSVLCAVDDSGNVNSGVMLFRRTKDVRPMLDAIWAQEQFTHHGWWENMALIHLLQTDSWFKEKCHVVPREYCRILQGYPGYAGEIGSPIIHFAGAMKGMMGGYVPHDLDFDALLRDIKTHFGSDDVR